MKEKISNISKKKIKGIDLSFLIGKKLLSFISSTLAETVGSSIKDSIISKEMLLYSECIRNLTKEMKNDDPTYFNSCSKLLKNSLNYKLTIIDYVNRLIKNIITNILIYQKVLSANNNGNELISNQLDYLYQKSILQKVFHIFLMTYMLKNGIY